MKKNIIIGLLFLHIVAVPTMLLGGEKTAPQATQELFNKYNLTEPEADLDAYVSELLQKYHLNHQPVPFTYQHKSEFFSSLMTESAAIPDTFEKIALHEHHMLDQSAFYKDIQITNYVEKVRKLQLKPNKTKKHTGEIFSVTTSDGETINATLLNRQSDVLVVVGGGFTNYREQMAMFGDMFANYDVLTFDFRGHGSEPSNTFAPNTWKSITQYLFNVEHKKLRLGLDEEKDTKAVVEYVKKKKNYRMVVGLGVCYSTMIFVKTEAIYPKTFDKLILDGCWLSLHHATDILSRDIGMIAHPQRSSAFADSWLAQQKWFRKSTLWLAESFLGVEFNTVSVLDYITQLRDLPILFIQGKDDQLIPRRQFETVWNATFVSKKAAWITSNEHVWNHLKQKEMYKQICELFITVPFAQFTELMVNPQELVGYKTEMLHKMKGD